ncbi:hypothetical protein H8356DRAFT_1418988 [Neocallimastix lanati (nom. inval.)]|jgi:hypothetical protein|uniref:Uncharacterized protein n=1 Tax=Neocallimastix californiae TaxID=1754190 RepID=A0A1Y2ERV7_9FUNG|nr:hypothetical protein H8356DRAFT_1418988 [Neocallimastix sp. JGI-2020a]ORY74247.1 hypothetical protein LY90DRAFT_699407 [Neocallimastix californiae]|eukprot:ORY74247.1 hypothetical protein LY90DRAFT_699407 [Neocallimastix californiae]
MSFLYKPLTSEYQSQYTWKLRTHNRGPQDILEKQLEELKELQDANKKRLTMLEEEMRSQFIPDEDELKITEREFKPNFLSRDNDNNFSVPKRETEELILPKLSDDTNVTKADNRNINNNGRPSSSSSHYSIRSNRGSCSSGYRSPKEVPPEKQVDALVGHFRRDGYGNNPWIGNKPTSFEYEKMKRHSSSKANIKNYDDNLVLRRAKLYDEYRKEIDLKRLRFLFPYVNFDELNWNAETQTYDDGVISGTFLSEYGDKYINWSRLPFPYNRRFERTSQKISRNEGNNVGVSTSDDIKNEESIHSLTKQMDNNLVLNEENLDFCKRCNGYYIKPNKTSSSDINKTVNSCGDNIVTYEQQPPY